MRNNLKKTNKKHAFVENRLHLKKHGITKKKSIIIVNYIMATRIQELMFHLCQLLPLLLFHHLHLSLI